MPAFQLGPGGHEIVVRAPPVSGYVFDPYGLHLNWKTIMTSAQQRTTEIFLNFPLMDMNRNVLHKDLLSADPDQIERMNRFRGSEEWQDILYKEDLKNYTQFVNILKICIFILGFAPGLRDLLRVMMGV